MTLTVVLCLMVWPFRYFYHSSYSPCGEAEPLYTGAVTMEEIVLQQFAPEKGHIHELSMACTVEDVHYMDRVFVTVYDAEYHILYQEVLHFYDIQTHGMIKITPEMDVVPGQIYYIGLNVHFDSIGTLRIAYADQNLLQINECGFFMYAGESYENAAALIRFHYTAPYSAGEIILRIAGIIICGLLFDLGVVLAVGIIKKKELTPRFLKGSLAVLSMAGALAAVFCFYRLCVVQSFGGEIWDILVYVAACLIGLLFWEYACYRGMRRLRCDSEQREDFVRQDSVGELSVQSRKIWINYLQMLCLVLLFRTGVEYVDATIQWKQDLARNTVFMLFGVFVLLTLKLRQVVNAASILWGILIIPAGMAYCHLKGPDEHALEAARVMAAAVFVWGIVLIHTLRGIKKFREQKIKIPLAACFGVMCIFMLVNSHGKPWPFLMAITFTLFYLQNYTEEEKDRIIHNMINALLIHFFFMVVMCCLYRPYHYYRFSRYPMWFHTVASTGMYLSIVAAAALLRLFLAMRNSGTVFRKAWKEWMLNGVVLVYIALALPRTAMVAVFGMWMVLAVGAAIVYRPKVRYYAQVAAVMLLSLILSIPVVYTMTRCIPAAVNKPVYLSEAEDFDGAIREGEAPDSDNYMYFRALVRMWANRLWVPEEFIQKYLEDKVSISEPFSILAEVASEELTGLPAKSETSGVNEMSNGRIAIFKDYLEHLNWSGHPEMGRDGDYEMLSGHAHNSFIQNAFDFGIPAGILLLLLILIMIFDAVYRIWTGKERSEKQFMQLLAGCAFLLVSLTEYVSNPCMPLCFSTLFMLVTMRTEKSVSK